MSNPTDKPQERVSDEDLAVLTYNLSAEARKSLLAQIVLELIESRAELKEQRASAKYRGHLDDCEFQINGHGRFCTCGYDALASYLKGGA